MLLYLYTYIYIYKQVAIDDSKRVCRQTGVAVLSGIVMVQRKSNTTLQ